MRTRFPRWTRFPLVLPEFPGYSYSDWFGLQARYDAVFAERMARRALYGCWWVLNALLYLYLVLRFCRRRAREAASCITADNSFRCRWCGTETPEYGVFRFSCCRLEAQRLWPDQ
jgi:hypothetical protein